MYKYVRLCKGVADRGTLLLEEQVISSIDTSHDWYQSVYYYNEDQYKQFQETGTIKGIKDVRTTKLVWDFDNKIDPELARIDTIQLVNHLKKWIPEDDIQIYFSGAKGFHLMLDTRVFGKTLPSKNLPLIFDSLRRHLALEIPEPFRDTVDLAIKDRVRLLRLPNSFFSSLP